MSELKVGDLISYLSNDPQEGVSDWHYCKILTIEQISMFQDNVISAGRNWQHGIHPSLIPAGFAIVPIEPTDKMVSGGLYPIKNKHRNTSICVWKAMLDAAPKPTDK